MLNSETEKTLDLLYALGRVFDLARAEHAELLALREENAQLREDLSRSVDQGLKSAQSGARNALLMGFAMSGEDGRQLAGKLIEAEIGGKSSGQ